MKNYFYIFIFSTLCAFAMIILDYSKKPDVLPEDIRQEMNISEAERNEIIMAEKDFQFNMKRDVFMLIILLLSMAMFHIKQKSLDKEAKLKESEEKIKAYASDIEEKENSLKTIKKEMRSMQAEMATIRDKHFAVLAHGKKLYEDIIGGGNSLKWRKADFEAFVEHYRTVDEALVSQIESTYSGLTPNNKFVLILQRIIGNDDDIRRITGMTQSSIRTMRHRISRKKSTAAGGMEAAARLQKAAM